MRRADAFRAECTAAEALSLSFRACLALYRTSIRLTPVCHKPTAVLGSQRYSSEMNHRDPRRRKRRCRAAAPAPEMQPSFTHELQNLFPWAPPGLPGDHHRLRKVLPARASDAQGTWPKALACSHKAECSECWPPWVVRWPGYMTSLCNLEW